MIDYRILPDQRLTVICLQGTTTAEEILAMSERLRSDLAFCSEYDALVDNTEVEHPPTVSELRILAEPRLLMIKEGAKLAVVAPADATYGISRMHQLLTQYRSPLTIEVFRDRAAALEWLGKEGLDIGATCAEMLGGE